MSLGRFFLIRWIRVLMGLGDNSVKPPDNSQTSQIKRALLVGINKYAMPGNDLNGCVNDVEDVYDLLTKEYGFEKDNVRVLTDERATKMDIIDRLHWLVDETQAGDIAVYYHSGHGTRVRDRNGDELDDCLDECVVTHDHDWDNPLIDDILADIFKKLVDGAYLNVVVDTCHSGTITRNFSNPEDDKNVSRKTRFLMPPFDIAARSFSRDLPVRHFGEKFNLPGNQRHVLLSGCKDDQYSEELYISGKVRGVLTHSMTSFLRSVLEPDTNWKMVRANVLEAIKKAGHEQIPQLSGMNELLKKEPFGGKV